MNDLTLSGIISEAFSDYGADGISFPVLTTQGSSSNTQAISDQFTCLAFGNTAALIKARANSGDRIVIQGRLGSEKLGTEKYHSAITIGRVLAITEAEKGTDFSNIVVSGDAEIQELKYVGAKDTALVPIRLTNYRYFTKDGETQTYRTFIGGSVWGDRAEALGQHAGTERPVTLLGGLRARSYEDKDGDTIEKIDVWVQEVLAGEDLAPQEAGSSQPSQKREAPAPKKPAARKRSSSLDDDPF